MALDTTTVAPDAARIDMLLALALLFARKKRGDADDEAGAQSDAESVTAGTLLEGLGAADREACAARLAWHDSISREDQAGWLAHTLGRVGEKHLHLDEHVHPSHVLAFLVREPPGARRLILANLPSSLAAPLAESLGITIPPAKRPDAADDLSSSAPIAEVTYVVRRTFLRGFVRLREIAAPSQFDLLSGAELARTLRLLGIRETALACRGITASESLAAFLSRFDAADALLIAAHITTLTDVSAARVRRAEDVLHRTMEREPGADSMLDRVGLEVTAAWLARQDDIRVRFARQKLPIEVADELTSLVAAARERDTADDSAPRLAAAADGVESVAAEVRRVTIDRRSKPRPPRPSR